MQPACPLCMTRRIESQTLTSIRVTFGNEQLALAGLINEQYFCGLFPLECPSGLVNTCNQSEKQKSTK